MTLERLDIHSCEDKFQVAQHRGRYDFALQYLQPADSVLEIGTGLGVFTEELCPRCASYTGVEYDEAACQAARQRTNANVLQGDARHLSFPDNHFSYIICLEVLEHLGDWKAGVTGIHRCLSPDGRAVISVPWRRTGGKSATNEYHLYEPGERELVTMFNALFRKVDVFYQYFEESAVMTVARGLHIRRFLGLDRIYADLTRGLPEATARLRIGPVAKGMKLVLIIAASGKK
jgi:ubiquinone/menaquinone biosynthesis C-methylase UbiE